MESYEIIMNMQNKLVSWTTREIKSILTDCSLSDLDKLDEIEDVIKYYRKKDKRIKDFAI